MKKILMIYSDYLFEDDIRFIASTGRFINIGQIYQKAGFQVVIATYASNKKKYYCEEKNGMKIHFFEKPVLSKIKDFVSLGDIFCEEIEKVENLDSFNSIVYYGTTLKFSKPIRKLSTKYNLSAISIVNEWGNFKVKQTPSFILQKFGIKFVTKKYDGVISISEFMQNHFYENGTSSILIPSIFDFEELTKPIKIDQDNEVVISYAGTIANGKDSMAVVLEAMAALRPDDLSRIRFHLYGSSEQQVKNALAEKTDEVLSALKDHLVFKGHYDRVQLQQELKKSDFTILIRPNLPYANAGFPTKFAESFALGVPVIANSTSDISKYLKTDVNGVLVCDDSLPAVIKALEKALTYSPKDLIELRNNAYKTAKKYFDYSNYDILISKFMKEMIK